MKVWNQSVELKYENYYGGSTLTQDIADWLEKN